MIYYLSFIEKSDICNFTDDNNLHFCEANLIVVLENLELDASTNTNT